MLSNLPTRGFLQLPPGFSPTPKNVGPFYLKEVMNYLEYFRRRSKEDTNGCWIWQGSKKLNGYGQMGYHTRSSECAHRVAYLELNGPLPSGHIVRHTCDNPACVNPKHLVSGSPADNIRDMQVRGRANYVNACKGSAVAHLAKLNEAHVLEIRQRSNTPQKVLAQMYGVTQAVISKVLLRKTWKHI